jgi:hypothetical protein
MDDGHLLLAVEEESGKPKTYGIYIQRAFVHLVP